MDRRRRLADRIGAERGWRPARVGTWVILADTRTNRRHVARHRRLLRRAFPANGHAMRSWLRTACRPDRRAVVPAISAASGSKPGSELAAPGPASVDRTPEASAA